MSTSKSPTPRTLTKTSQQAAPLPLVRLKMTSSELEACLETVSTLVTMLENTRKIGDFNLYPAQCFVAKLKQRSMPTKDPISSPPADRTEALLGPWLADMKESIAKASRIYVDSYDVYSIQKARLYEDLKAMKSELENRIAKP